MGKHTKSLRVMACLGIATSMLGLAGCASSSSQTAMTPADKQLATDVSNNLGRAPDTTFPNVAVSADSGRVQLRGYVSSEAQKAEAARITSQVPGVTEVQNNLTVGQSNQPVGGATAPGGYPEVPHY
jgi:osmotically-inducible protein OsmY